MITTGFSLVLMAVAFVATTLVYPYVLAFAKKHNIVDNPSARKLQRVPVPVMGGTAVFIGFVVAVFVGYLFYPDPQILKLMALLLVMYAIGVWDDMKDVSVAFRFLVELVVVWMMIILLEVEVNNFYGFFGVYDIPDVVSVPLSLVAGVGIMNAINLIDGVDGYCCSYGVMACVAYAIIFYFAGNITLVALALIGIGALIPFFFHNVFGKTSKMFMGDGGSLMLGTLLAYFTFTALTTGRRCDLTFTESGLSLAALCLAILAVPVFDTLKVMIFRVIRGQSPFHPDKTHLHHIFIEMNFSHLSTSFMIVLGNVLIIGILLLSWWLGASITMQVIIVVFFSLLFTWGFYFFMDYHRRQNEGDGTLLWQRVCSHGSGSSLSSRPAWQWIRKVVDSRFLGGKPVVAAPAEDKLKQDPRIQ